MPPQLGCGHRSDGPGGSSRPWACPSTAEVRCRPGPVADTISEHPSARPCAPPGRRAARSWGAGAQYLSDLPPGSTSRNFLRLGGWQIGTIVDAGPQRRGRRCGDRSCRRARPGGAGIHPGRSRPGEPCAFAHAKDEATGIADGYRRLKEIMGVLETEN
jgi:hypothetical protein